MNIRNAGIILALFASLTVGVTQAQQSPVPQAVNKSVAGKTMPSGVDLTAIDPDTRPQDDFYQFANGTWLNKTNVPATSSGYTIYNEVYDQAEKTLRNIIEVAAKSASQPGSEAQKVGDLFTSWMNKSAIEEKGLTPLTQEISRINKITNRAELVALWADFIRKRIDAPIGFYIHLNLKKATEYAVYFSQDGLTLPDREYYLNQNNPNFVAVRQALPEFIRTMIAFVDPSISIERATAVYQLEYLMAIHHWTRVENRNNEKTYNLYNVDQLNQLGSNIDWMLLIQELGLTKVDQVIISQPSYFQAIDTLIGNVDITIWKDYLTYNLIRSYANHLPQAIDDANFNFMSTRLSGQTQQQPRWKRGIAIVNSALGEVVGKLYVEQRFPAAAKQKMTQLVNNIVAVFYTSIDQLEWMSDETKVAAKLKLAKLNSKIGYPDHWRDYSDLTIVKGDHLGNIKRSREFDYNRDINKLGNPIDRNEWFMTPQTVNAYYDPAQNEIVFPAARLQPPLFQPNADDAVNYGAIGSVIGHEISHAFDDAGSQYDGNGNLRNWWTAEDREAFEQRAAKLVEQYNQYSPIEGMHINGELTLGENIGDLSGVTIAYQAYLRSLNNQLPPVIDGFTGPQRFFLGYAMSRRGKYKRESAISQLTSDPHSPLKYRVNGIYSNIPEFYLTFGVKQGDGMWIAPENRVKIW
ncbi:M13 family metallopeptidase [Neptunicella sp. SCSIO 80796]|uniref:M13 family metallopeptidase n=1 Tax=Neptunicella plasticusilytica TaxID=3117012 RepID=UPI003A4D8847